MLLRSGRIVINPELVNTQLQYWKRKTMLYLDKLQFIPPDNPAHTECYNTIDIYHMIISETRQKFHTNPYQLNPYFTKEIMLELSTRVDQELLQPLIGLYQRLKYANYPTNCYRRKSHRLLKNNCAVCLESIHPGDITQSCHGKNPHYYHRQCLVNWMISSCLNARKCPLCLERINQKCLWKVI